MPTLAPLHFHPSPSELARLSAAHAEVLVRHEVKLEPLASIADAIGVPAGTIASRLYHARRAVIEGRTPRSAMKSDHRIPFSEGLLKTIRFRLLILIEDVHGMTISAVEKAAKRPNSTYMRKLRPSPPNSVVSLTCEDVDEILAVLGRRAEDVLGPAMAVDDVGILRWIRSHPLSTATDLGPIFQGGEHACRRLIAQRLVDEDDDGHLTITRAGKAAIVNPSPSLGI